MNKSQLIEWVTISGEILIVISAALWITGWGPVRFIFAIGTLAFATGRLMIPHDNSSVTLKRLYTQQNIGAIFAIISALLMFFYDKLDGLELSDYVVHSTKSAWLLPFVIFVVLEVYTTFRIPSVLKKEQGPELKVRK